MPGERVERVDVLDDADREGRLGAAPVAGSTLVVTATALGDEERRRRTPGIAGAPTIAAATASDDDAAR